VLEDADIEQAANGIVHPQPGQPASPGQAGGCECSLANGTMMASASATVVKLVRMD
jgi:hypothetical protein